MSDELAEHERCTTPKCNHGLGNHVANFGCRMCDCPEYTTAEPHPPDELVGAQFLSEATAVLQAMAEDGIRIDDRRFARYVHAVIVEYDRRGEDYEALRREYDRQGRELAEARTRMALLERENEYLGRCRREDDR